MKKFLKVFVFFFFFLIIYVPDVFAVTINDYRNDLSKLKEKKAQVEANYAKTQEEIKATKEKMAQLARDMVNTIKEQEEKEKEIVELEKKIASKEEEIKDLVVFHQVSGSENFYLKYIFGAESFTDFIYRFSVIEQLSKRNDELVKEMDALVKMNEVKIKELKAKKLEIEKLETESKKQLAKLDDQKSIYAEEGGTYDEQIAALEKQINYFKNQGCGENEDLSICLSVPPEDSSYIKPIKNGFVSDDYGPRVSPCYGCSSFHKGMDLAAAEGTAVYAVAAGRVSNIDRYSCGGNVVTINHTVDGRSITTRYWHLLSYNVSVGDIVVQGQQIAQVGGGPRSTDSCTTGAHLHFETVEGHYYGTGVDSYSSYSTYLENVFDPRKVIWFPAYGVSW